MPNAPRCGKDDWVACAVNETQKLYILSPFWAVRVARRLQRHFFEFSNFDPAQALKTVFTIAGFDPSSGAGITADLKVFAAHGLFGTSCITALTVQSTTGVRAVHPVPGDTLRATLQCLEEDLPPAGIKIGMLATSDNVKAAAQYLEDLRSRAGRQVPVVVDPVLQSSSGATLLDERGVDALRERLLPLADWVMPNIGELALLSGQPVEDRDAVPEACRVLQGTVAGWSGGAPPGIFAKGGHLAQPDDYLLSPNGDEMWMSGERVGARSMHGTGCALSSAFLSQLVLGRVASEAAQLAKAYVAEAIRSAPELGLGSGILNHLWPLMKVSDPE